MSSHQYRNSHNRLILIIEIPMFGNTIFILIWDPGYCLWSVKHPKSVIDPKVKTVAPEDVSHQGFCILYWVPFPQGPVVVWWHHYTDTLSTSQAHCADNSPVTGDFPHKAPAIRSFDGIFVSFKSFSNIYSTGWLTIMELILPLKWYICIN